MLEWNFSLLSSILQQPFGSLGQAERGKNTDFVCSAPPLKRDALFSEARSMHTQKSCFCLGAGSKSISQWEGRAASNLILPDTFCYSRWAIYNGLGRLQRPFFSEIHTHSRQVEKKIPRKFLNLEWAKFPPSQQNRRSRERMAHAGCDCWDFIFARG